MSEKEKQMKEKEEEKAMNDYIDGLRLRSKRKIHREYEKGVITWDNEEKLFLDMEGNPVVGLHFKNKGVEDMFEDEEDEEDDLDDLDM